MATYEKGILAKNECHDPASGSRLLVVKLAERSAKEICQTVESMRVADDIVVYFYHRTVAAQVLP